MIVAMNCAIDVVDGANPLDSIATLTINGSLQQFGTLPLRLGADGQNDRLVVNGSASLDGSLSLSGILPGYAPQTGTEWVLITSSEPISGSFDSVFTEFGIDYETDPDQVIARYV